MNRVHAGVVALLLVAAPAQGRALAPCATRGDTLGWYVPDHAKVQTGGLLGFLTLAVGYSAFDILDFDLYYGWVPAPIGGTTIHSIALRVAAHLEPVCLAPDLSWTYLMAGVGMVMTFGEGFFLETPAQYPEGYYDETAVRGIVALGSEVALHQPEGSLFARHALFMELTALDEYLLVWFENPGEVAPWEVWSLSFGYKAGF